MKSVLLLFLLTTCPVQAYAEPDEKTINIACNDLAWSDVVILVEPYLDETLYVALVMQGQSSEYKTSVAASMAMDNSLPDVVQLILKEIMAKC